MEGKFSLNFSNTKQKFKTTGHCTTQEAQPNVHLQECYETQLVKHQIRVGFVKINELLKIPTSVVVEQQDKQSIA